ncbi:MAG: hypothetical protein WCA08_24685 [Desulfoferrobacter sp.]
MPTTAKSLKAILPWVIYALGILGFFLVEATPAPATPPPWAPAHGYRAKHQYLYYPSAQVYFEPSRGLYFYFSGGHWAVSVSLPHGIHIDRGSAVTLGMDTGKPYKYHSEVVKRYPPGHGKEHYKHERYEDDISGKPGKSSKAGKPNKPGKQMNPKKY